METESYNRFSYDELIADNPELVDVVNKDSWDYITGSDKHTVKFLKDEWKDNVKKNIKTLWKKHGGMVKDCVRLGKNKAIIAIGAGASFNKNKNYLKLIHDIDGQKQTWRERDFIFIASNHQYKPLLDMGIIPDFVVLTDGSEVVDRHLIQDIPKIGQNTILLAGIHCSNKVLKEWSKQGRRIRFYISNTPLIGNYFRKLTNENPKPNQVLQGGNVINTTWSLALRFFESSVFMCVGNDLSYEIKDSVDDQRMTYYADKDYSANLDNKRDEAGRSKRWAGFSLNKSPIILPGMKPRYNITLDLVGTSPTLWVYKTWAEVQAVLNMKREDIKYHYYNCSEGGILGVICKDHSDKGLEKIDNWYMLDEKCRRWHTTTLNDAVVEFLTAKGKLAWQSEETPYGVHPAIDLEAKYTGDIVSLAQTNQKMSLLSQ